MRVDSKRLNDARWAANEVWIEPNNFLTMEQATEIADAAVRAYLGLSPEEWEEAT